MLWQWSSKAMAKKLLLDLNCDMGESAAMLADGTEATLMQYITSANIACGGHAGDRKTREASVRLALEHGVRIGAHPSYPDYENFGRIEMPMAENKLEESIVEQIGALAETAARYGAYITHIKPHGALYHAADRDAAIARIIARAAGRISPKSTLVGRAGSPMLPVWQETGFAVSGEAFADRVYEANGKLRSRTLPDCMHSDPQKAAEQAWRIAQDHKIVALDGTEVPIQADTVCIHSDTSGSVAIARAVYERLSKERI